MMGIMKIHYVHNVGKYDPPVLDYPVTFVPRSARCSSVLCLSIYLSIYLSLYLPQGSYKLPKVSFEVDAAVFPPGDYHAKGELSFGGKSAGCVELYASFA